jgi:hypothetical protein
MTHDNEAIVRNAYHTAEGSVLDIPGWIGSFTEDGVFNNVTGEESYRGEHLKDIVIVFAKMFPDVHRELYRVNRMGDVVAIELAIQGTFRGPKDAIAQALAHQDGPVVVDAVVDPFALSLPAHVPFHAVKGYTLSIGKQVLSGRMDSVIKTIKRNVGLV